MTIGRKVSGNRCFKGIFTNLDSYLPNQGIGTIMCLKHSVNLTLTGTYPGIFSLISCNLDSFFHISTYSSNNLYYKIISIFTSLDIIENVEHLLSSHNVKKYNSEIPYL